MSKKIDFSKPLSEEDEAYVAERPWLRVDAELSGFDLSDETDFSVDGGVDEGSENPDGFEPEDAASDESDEENEEGEGDEDEVAPYSEWDYQELKAEAKRRYLSAAGSKEQLVDRLTENDGTE